MYLYLGLMFIPVFFILTKKNYSKKMYDNLFIFFILFLFLFVGLRTVGSDYHIYERHYHTFQNIKTFLPTASGDLAYDYLNYILSSNGIPFFVVTLIASAIFMFSLWLFLKNLPDPFLGLFFSMPFYIINFSMSAIRQSFALAFLIFALFFIQKNKKIFFYISIIFGTLFHKTVIIFCIIGSIYKKISTKHLIIFSIVAVGMLLYKGNEFLRMFQIYIGWKQQLVSYGVYMRFIPIFFSVLIFYNFYKKLPMFDQNDKEILLVITFLCILFSPFLLIDTTTADRMYSYIGIFQIVIFTKFITFFEKQKKTYFTLLGLFVFFYIGNFIVWFQFGTVSFQWEKYQSILNL
jgi:hypothetical protein